MLQNPLHISLPLHDVYLLWSFKETSGDTSRLICNEMMQKTTESPVHTQHLNSVMLKPDCIQEVCMPIHLPMYTIVNTVKPLFIIFVRGLKKKQWIREKNRCGSLSLNRIRSGTIEIEPGKRIIREQ
jgi:hypothetical protein